MEWVVIGIAILFFGSLLVRDEVLRRREMKARKPIPTVVKWTHHERDRVIVLSDGRAFVGMSTVWRDAETAERASSSDERMLSRMNKEIEWGRHNDKHLLHTTEERDALLRELNLLRTEQKDEGEL